ncbi:MAG: hypothetical protein WC971_00850 [Coriobacteriia bacterium]
MRRLVAALVIVTVAFSLAGCGGKAAETAAPAPDAAAAAAPPPAAAAAAPVADDSPTEVVDLALFPVDKAITPESITNRLEMRQPMVLYFYDPLQSDTNDVRVEIDAALKKYRGLIDLLTFDVGARLRSGGASDAAAAKTALMTDQLRVSYTPYIIMVDRNGFMVWRGRGFFDRGILEREVLRATE